MIRVLVRSSSPFARRGLEGAIAADPRFAVVSGTSREPDQQPDVIVLDGPDADPVRALSGPVGSRPPSLVLLTDDLSRTEFARLYQTGVRAALPRDSSVQEIASAIEAVSQNLAALSPEFLEALLPVMSEDRDADVVFLQEPLTAREIEVLALMAEGAENKEIAGRLKISEHTAKFHVSSILGKLGATSRTEAVTRGYRLGLIFI